MNGGGLIFILMFGTGVCQQILMDCQAGEKFVTINYLQNGEARQGPFTQPSVFAII